jgi:hypothetical protein
MSVLLWKQPEFTQKSHYLQRQRSRPRTVTVRGYLFWQRKSEILIPNSLPNSLTHHATWTHTFLGPSVECRQIAGKEACQSAALPSVKRMLQLCRHQNTVHLIGSHIFPLLLEWVHCDSDGSDAKSWPTMSWLVCWTGLWKSLILPSQRAPVLMPGEELEFTWNDLQEVSSAWLSSIMWSHVHRRCSLGEYYTIHIISVLAFSSHSWHPHLSRFVCLSVTAEAREAYRLRQKRFYLGACQQM